MLFIGLKRSPWFGFAIVTKWRCIPVRHLTDNFNGQGLGSALHGRAGSPKEKHTQRVCFSFGCYYWDENPEGGRTPLTGKYKTLSPA